MSREAVKRNVIQNWPPFDVVTAKELTTAGIGDKLRGAAVRFRILYRLRRGAYVRADLWDEADISMRDLMRIRAHFLTTPHTGTYTHITAARLHGLHMWKVPPTIHLTQPFASTRSSRGPDTTTHHQLLDPGELVTLLGPRGERYTVTNLERTVIDCARTLELHRAAIIGDHALRLGAESARILELLDSMDSVRGVRKARDCMEGLDARAESPGETRTRLLFRSFNIPMPEPQIEVRSRLGNHRGDFGWRGLKLIAEFDGRTKYFQYRPTEQTIYEERQREKALMEEGWHFFRIEWADLSRPWELKARLLAAMARAESWNQAMRATG